MNNLMRLAAAGAALAAGVWAVETRLWEHSTRADFEKGTLEGLALRSDGRLTLAPEVRQLLDASAAYLWALAADSKGYLYAGGGSPGGAAKIFRIAPDGATKSFAEIEGFEIQALVVDRADRLYAATSPDGKVYRIGPDGKPELIYEPRTKYIWALAINSKGELFVGTGERGEIHRVGPDGRGGVFAATDETHVRSLAVDAADNLIAGTEPGGLILRIAPDGRPFVVHQTAKREVTAVVAGRDGIIYAAAVGDKQPVAAPSLPPALPAPAPPTAQPGAAPAPAQAAPERSQPPPPPAPLIRPTVTGGSEVVRIDPEGFPRTVWTDPKEIVYSLAVTVGGELLIGTGDEGKLFRLEAPQEPSRRYTLLATIPPKQITALVAADDGRIFAATGNVGRVYQFGARLASQGTFESPVLNAEFFSYWGALRYAGAATKGSILFETRSGNLERPHRNWSPWAKVELAGTSGRIASPPARFLQYRVRLAGTGNQSPELRRVEIAYLNRNVAPEITRIAFTPPNYRFPPRALAVSSPKTLNLPPLAESRTPAPPKPVPVAPAQSVQYAKGYQSARWLAADDNGDELIFKVEIRGVAESSWKLLQDELTDPYLSWDTTAFADGEYLLRVTVSDRNSNPPEKALSTELVSEPFLIDNTPPEVPRLTATRSGGALRLEWAAADALSPIQRAEYSINGGEWRLAEPVTRLMDSPRLEFVVELNPPPDGEQAIAVRVTDQFDNQRVASVVVR
jgi:hypothetical protein